MRLRSHGTVAIVVLLILILGFFLPPLVNVNRYRARIASSIERAMGRPVTVGSISLRLFPQPGFDLGNVSIGEDPAFGHEPMLHAEEVQASLRLSSLWRGKLEIAKLSLKYPSLNLVRAEDGRWNLESLLQRASSIPTAPTGKTRPESRPRFPYIEAEGGRINFKVGVEKKVYALADADFALWLAAEDELRTRLKARMVRTDSYLSDTGQVTLNGRFQRASDLRDTPMEIEARLEKSQLGQLTKFIDGNDHGWRGRVDADLRVTGRPTALKVSAQTVVDDFRRYDISTTEYVKLEVRCSTVIDMPAQHLADISCRMPVSNGVVTVAGSVDGFVPLRSYDLKISAAEVPTQSVVAIVRHAKKDIPEDLSATGSVDAEFALRRDGATGVDDWSGRGTSSEMVLRASVLNPELILKPIEFSIQTPKPENSKSKRGKGLPRPVSAVCCEAAEDARLQFSPFALDLGGGTPGRVLAWVNRKGYELDVQGDAQIKRLLQVAQAAGVRAPHINAEGAAKLEVTIAGKWRGFSSPKPVGTAQMRGLTVRMKGIAEPLRVASTTLNLGPDSVTASNLNAEFTQSGLALDGWVKLPRQCESLETCPITFDLHADQVVTDDVNRLVNPRAAKRPWYAILGGTPESSFLGKIQARGRISAGKLVMKSVVANRVTAGASLDAGVLNLSDVRGELWNGKHVGEWRADFSGDTPAYTGTGTVDSVALAQVAALAHDNWASGNAGGSYKLAMSGDTATQLLGNAKGELSFNWNNGSLRHVTLGNATAPLSFRQFAGVLEFSGGKIRLSPGSKMTTSSGIYEVSGTASAAREMDLTLRNGTHIYNVTGPLEKPKVTPAPATQAQVSLKQ